MKEGLGWRKSCQQVELESLVGDLLHACKVVHLGTQLLRAWRGRGGGGVVEKSVGTQLPNKVWVSKYVDL